MWIFAPNLLGNCIDAWWGKAFFNPFSFLLEDMVWLKSLTLMDCYSELGFSFWNRCADKWKGLFSDEIWLISNRDIKIIFWGGKLLYLCLFKREICYYTLATSHRTYSGMYYPRPECGNVTLKIPFFLASLEKLRVTNQWMFGFCLISLFCSCY